MKQQRYSADDKAFVYLQIAGGQFAPDAWPYSPTFDEHFAEFNARQLVPISQAEYWRILLAVRKRGVERTVEAQHVSPRKLDGVLVGRLRELMPRKRGQIDSLPYSDRFEEIYNTLTARLVERPTRRDIWLTILKIAKSRVRRAAKPYLTKAIDSFWRAINTFNMMGSRGRSESVLIDIHHGFEMLLKASLIQRRVNIKDPHSPGWNVSFSKCINMAETSGEHRFLENNDAAYLRGLDVIRGLAYHALIECDEVELYLQTKIGVQLVDKLLGVIFDTTLADHLEGRVLPICTMPLPNMLLFLNQKQTQIKSLLAAGEQERARAATATLMTFENAVAGKADVGPSERDARRISNEIVDSNDIASIFPSIAATPIVTDSSGTTIHLSVHGRTNHPIIPSTDTAAISTVAIRRVNPSQEFPLSHHDLATKLNLTFNEVTGVIKELGLDGDEQCCYRHGRPNAKTSSKGYSAKAISKAREYLASSGVKPLDLWRKHCLKRRVV